MKTALILALALGTATAVVEPPPPIIWRDGPVKIEAQLGERPQPVANIVFIAADGVAFRDGVPVEALDRDDLLALVRDLLDYELAKSWPPERSEPPRRRRSR